MKKIKTLIKLTKVLMTKYKYNERSYRLSGKKLNFLSEFKINKKRKIKIIKVYSYGRPTQ